MKIKTDLLLESLSTFQGFLLVFLRVVEIFFSENSQKIYKEILDLEIWESDLKVPKEGLY